MRHPDLPDPKPGHIGPAAHPFGPTVYAIVDHTGAICDVAGTRHGAVGKIADRHYITNDYRVVPVPIGSVPIKDLRVVPGV